MILFQISMFKKASELLKQSDKYRLKRYLCALFAHIYLELNNKYKLEQLYLLCKDNIIYNYRTDFISYFKENYEFSVDPFRYGCAKSTSDDFIWNKEDVESYAVLKLLWLYKSCVEMHEAGRLFEICDDDNAAILKIAYFLTRHNYPDSANMHFFISTVDLLLRLTIAVLEKCDPKDAIVACPNQFLNNYIKLVESCGYETIDIIINDYISANLDREYIEKYFANRDREFFAANSIDVLLSKHFENDDLALSNWIRQ
jgi:hypothetical protein